MGVDLGIVSLLIERCETRSVSGEPDCQELGPLDGVPLPRDLVELGFQRPRGLVPIGTLQQALLEVATRRGAKVMYDFDVVKLRRHNQRTSLTCSQGRSTSATLVVIATGAARALVHEPAFVTASQRMIAGVFAEGDIPTWMRFPVAVRGFARPARATVLQTREAGTAMIVGTPIEKPSDEQLHVCFEAAASECELAGARFLAAPRPFVTTVSTSAHRVIAGSNRAPVVIAGDAAQTGHVFTGQTCFMNIALALRLTDELKKTRALGTGELAALAPAFERYERASEVGATVLHRASTNHITVQARA
jgi:2-polyprenyl-6-methoxyphenol hydroxylase-like FAD-dependent oxidoreductase